MSNNKKFAKKFHLSTKLRLFKGRGPHENCTQAGFTKGFPCNITRESISKSFESRNFQVPKNSKSVFFMVKLYFPPSFLLRLSLYSSFSENLFSIPESTLAANRKPRQKCTVQLFWRGPHILFVILYIRLYRGFTELVPLRICMRAIPKFSVFSKVK